MKKIRIMSQSLLWIFKVLAIWLPITWLLFWIDAPSGLIKQYLGTGWNSLLTANYLADTPPILHTLSANTKLLGLLISLIPLIIQLLTLYYLIRLFRNYADLDIFTMKNAQFIKRIGWITLIGQILTPIHDALLSIAVTWSNPAGHRMMTITVDKTNLALIICAILIILVSWVMTEAYKEQETSKLIV